MSTRGYIAIYNPEDKKYYGFYNHWDNYLSGTGLILIQSEIALNSMDIKEIQKVFDQDYDYGITSFSTPGQVIAKGDELGCDYVYIRYNHVWYFNCPGELKFGSVKDLASNRYLTSVVAGLIKEMEAND